MPSEENKEHLPVGYLLRAPFYILFLQTLRFYHQFFAAAKRWAKRLCRRIAHSLFVIFCKPFVLMGHGNLLAGTARLVMQAALCLWGVLLVVPCVRNTLGFGISYMGRVVAVTQTAETAENGILRATQVMQFFDMPETPTVTRVVAEKRTLCDVGGVSDALVACHGDALTRAGGLFIDGDFIGAVEDTDALKTMLEALRTARDDGTETKPSTFVQKTEITDGAYPNDTLLTADALREKLLSAQRAPLCYTVQNGDTLIGIARANGLTLRELRERNPAFADSDLVHAGDSLVIQPAAGLLQVRRYIQKTYTEVIPYETKILQNNRHYVGEKHISVRGVNGSQEVTAEIELTDGVETGRTVLKATVLKMPVTRKVQVGTRRGSRTGKYVNGDGVATGSYTWPAPGMRTITSYFGRRWGTVHQGLDISGYNAKGKPIVAADGGRVYAVNSTSTWGTGIFAGYGYAVIIDHGNGVKTLYAHCSKIAVKAGQKVTKGQTIAYIGSTGYSTGAHLHFEVRVNNRRVDPLPYLQ